MDPGRGVEVCDGGHVLEEEERTVGARTPVAEDGHGRLVLRQPAQLDTNRSPSSRTDSQFPTSSHPRRTSFALPAP